MDDQQGNKLKRNVLYLQEKENGHTRLHMDVEFEALMSEDIKCQVEGYLTPIYAWNFDKLQEI